MEPNRPKQKMLLNSEPQQRKLKPKSVYLVRVRYGSSKHDLWCATDNEGYADYVRAGTRYEAAVRLGVLDLLKKSA